MRMKCIGAAIVFAMLVTYHAHGQNTSVPTVITLQDAINRAKLFDSQFQTAISDALLAKEDRLQAKAAMFPTWSATTQYLGTQGNGQFPSGRFITNDGIHVYRAWSVVHQDLSPSIIFQTGYKRAQVAEAVAKAKVEVAQRGLEQAVTTNYYALVTAERKQVTAQQVVELAQRFLEVTQEQERLGLAAHADVVKAELQYQQQKQSFDDLTLATENARLNLAVMIMTTVTESFTVLDDLETAQILPPFAALRSLAEKQNPELRVASESVKQATFDIKTAKNALLPSLVIDTVYGIEANAFRLHSSVAADPEHRIVPNLGYFITANLSVPIWDWGALKSKVRQSEVRQKQAQTQLTQAQRQLIGNLFTAYNEARAARSAVDSMRHAAELANESLQLTNLRYQAGESLALEVVDAQNALIQVRNAYDDAQSRYRLAIATLQSLTGGF